MDHHVLFEYNGPTGITFYEYDDGAEISVSYEKPDRTNFLYQKNYGFSGGGFVLCQNGVGEKQEPMSDDLAKQVVKLLGGRTGPNIGFDLSGGPMWKEFMKAAFCGNGDPHKKSSGDNGGFFLGGLL